MNHMYLNNIYDKVFLAKKNIPLCGDMNAKVRQIMKN